MKKILEAISLEMIRVAEFEEFCHLNHYPERQVQSKWFGNPPINASTIQEAEERLQVTLPEDYKGFFSIANGFYSFSNVDPTFHSVDVIDYLKNIDAELIEIWREGENEYYIADIESTADVLAQSILIAGFGEEQYFLLIPPSETNKTWRYWKFAAWIPGEKPFDNLEDYFKNVLESLTSW